VPQVLTGDQHDGLLAALVDLERHQIGEAGQGLRSPVGNNSIVLDNATTYCAGRDQSDRK
jgi:hypothetical protein